MYKIKKQSNIDYQVTFNNKHFAWVTKSPEGYTMANLTYIFKTLKDVKTYIHNL